MCYEFVRQLSGPHRNLFWRVCCLPVPRNALIAASIWGAVTGVVIGIAA